MQRIAAILVVCAVSMGFGLSAAWAYGAFVGPDGAVAMEASRTAVVRSGDSVELIIQSKYAGTPAELVWLIAIPNFNEPADDGVIALGADASVLDALDAQTRPQFAGQCEDGPNGEMTDYEFAAFAAAQNDALPRRFFTAQDLDDGKLDEYLAGLAFTPDEAIQAAASAALDKNFMIVALRISTADLGVNKIDPIVSIRYPLAAGENVEISVRQAGASTPMDPARILFFALAGERMQGSLTTREVDPETVMFTSADATNYEAAFDALAMPLQTRAFVTEHAGAAVAGGFDNAAVDALINDSGASFLTRLHVRMAGAALRAAGSDVVELRGAGNADYNRLLNVAGSTCGGGPEPDMGEAPAADMGVDPADSGVDPTDAGQLPRSDAGETGGDDDGGGGGCSAAPGTVAFPLLMLALAFTSRRRRR